VGLLIALSLPVFVVPRRVRAYGRDYCLRLYPLYAFFPERNLFAADLGHGVRVSSWQDRRSILGFPRLIVEWGGGSVWEHQWAIHWRIDSANETSDGRHRLIDLDGNGTRELILVTNHGGTGSNDLFTILSFSCSGGRARLHREYWFEGLGDFEDADGDGWPAELHYTSKYYKYRWTGGASSPFPRVWTRFGETPDRSGLRIAADLFHQPPPEPGVIEACIAEAKSGRIGAHTRALHVALDMIYSGHAAGALRLLEAVDPYYPRDADGPPLSEQVFRAVRGAPFGEEIMALNAPIAAPGTEVSDVGGE